MKRDMEIRMCTHGGDYTFRAYVSSRDYAPVSRSRCQNAVFARACESHCINCTLRKNENYAGGKADFLRLDDSRCLRRRALLSHWRLSQCDFPRNPKPDGIEVPAVVMRAPDAYDDETPCCGNVGRKNRCALSDDYCVKNHGGHTRERVCALIIAGEVRWKLHARFPLSDRSRSIYFYALADATARKEGSIIPSLGFVKALSMFGCGFCADPRNRDRFNGTFAQNQTITERIVASEVSVRVRQSPG